MKYAACTGSPKSYFFAKARVLNPDLEAGVSACISPDLVIRPDARALDTFELVKSAELSKVA